MSEEKTTLQQMLSETIHAFCAQDGFGIPAGFVYCVSRIAENGEQVLTLGSGEGRHTHISVGLARYLTKNFELDVESELTAWYEAHAAEDED